MPGATSPWRVNVVVAYDRMRDAASTLTGLLLAIIRTDGGGPVATEELPRLHRDLVEVDGYDRAAVAALAERIVRRIAELQERAR